MDSILNINDIKTFTLFMPERAKYDILIQPGCFKGFLKQSKFGKCYG